MLEINEIELNQVSVYRNTMGRGGTVKKRLVEQIFSVPAAVSFQKACVLRSSVKNLLTLPKLAFQASFS